MAQSKEELWKKVDPKGRNKIRNANKSGIIFGVESEIDSLEDCYALLKSVYKRIKLPMIEYSLFTSLIKNLSTDAKLILFTARFEGEIIGCRINLGYKGFLYDYYAGALPEYYNKYPNDLLPWEIFLWGKANGYHTFKFGGAGKPGIPYGVRDYKMKFGGVLKNYGRYKYICNKSLYKLGEIGVKLLKKYG